MLLQVSGQMGNSFQNMVMKVGPYKTINLQILFIADFVGRRFICHRGYTKGRIILAFYYISTSLIMILCWLLLAHEIVNKKRYHVKDVSALVYLTSLFGGVPINILVLYIIKTGTKRTLEFAENNLGIDWKKYEQTGKDEIHYETTDEILITKMILQAMVISVFFFYVPKMVYIVLVNDENAYADISLYILPMGYINKVHTFKIYALIWLLQAYAVSPCYLILVCYLTSIILQGLQYKNGFIRLSNIVENDSINTRQQIEFLILENTQIHEHRQKIATLSEQFQQRTIAYLLLYRHLTS